MNHRAVRAHPSPSKSCEFRSRGRMVLLPVNPLRRFFVDLRRRLRRTYSCRDTGTRRPFECAFGNQVWCKSWFPSSHLNPFPASSAAVIRNMDGKNDGVIDTLVLPLRTALGDIKTISDGPRLMSVAKGRNCYQSKRHCADCRYPEYPSKRVCNQLAIPEANESRQSN